MHGAEETERQMSEMGPRTIHNEKRQRRTFLDVYGPEETRRGLPSLSSKAVTLVLAAFLLLQKECGQKLGLGEVGWLSERCQFIFARKCRKMSA